MKKSFLILAVISFLFSNFAYSQWVAQTSGVGTAALNSVSFISATTGLAVGANGTIIKTTNGGTTWVAKSSLTANTLNEVQFITATTAVTVGQFGIILLSTNAGESWTNQTSGVNLNSVYFPSPTRGYAVGTTGTILKTTNGGFNWTAQTSGTTALLTSVHFLSDTVGYTCSAGGDVLKTTNGGTNWTVNATGFPNTLYSVSFATANTGWVCTTIGGIRKTTNAGINWTSQNSGGSNQLNGIQFKDVNSGWCVGTTGRIISTTNGGTNWTGQTSPTTNNLNSVFMVSTTMGWIVGDNGTVLKTTTGGLSAPGAPTLVLPGNGASNISVTPTFQWNASAGATSYKIQISTISNFGVITDSATVTTNSYAIAPGILQNASAYFWRINASNSLGTSAYSTTFNFSTTVSPPPVPVLVSPANNSNGQSTTPTLVWQAITGVTSYHVQVSTLSNFAIITDSGTVAGSVNQRIVPAGKLGNGLTYFWRVRATNASGTGSFSSPWNFSTLPTGINLITSEIPKEFKLFNNFPNPFNPTTKIKFNIPKSELVSLKVYNSTGMLVSELVNGNLSAGSYETEFKASDFASGVYFYKLESESFTDTRRMMLVK